MPHINLTEPKRICLLSYISFLCTLYLSVSLSFSPSRQIFFCFSPTPPTYHHPNTLSRCPTDLKTPMARRRLRAATARRPPRPAPARKAPATKRLCAPSVEQQLEARGGSGGAACVYVCTRGPRHHHMCVCVCVTRSFTNQPTNRFFFSVL